MTFVDEKTTRSPIETEWTCGDVASAATALDLYEVFTGDLRASSSAGDTGCFNAYSGFGGNHAIYTENQYFYHEVEHTG